MSRRWPIILAVLAVFAYACALQGVRPLYSPDEGRYTNVALNMLASGDWLRPTLHPDLEHWAKPPLTYWSIAASVAAFGHSEFAVRLPNALAFGFTILLMARLGRRFVPAQPWLPALTYATFAFPALAANLVTTDTLLTLWEAATAAAFVELWWAATPTIAHRARLLLWLAAALAFMTKGPPGLLALAACALFALWSDGARGLRRLFALDALAMFLIVGGTWYAIVAIREPGVLHYFLVEEVVNRVATDRMHRNAEWYGAHKIYAPTVVLGMLPWLVFIVPAWWKRRRGFAARVRAEPESRLLACWFLLPLAVFLVSRSRLPLYLLPLFGPLALIAARALAPLDLARRATQLALAAWCVVIVLLRAAPRFVDVPADDGALAQAIRAGVPALPDEIAFVDSDPRYGLRFYLGSAIERFELYDDVPLDRSQAIADGLREREGCRLLLVNDYNAGPLQLFLENSHTAFRRLPDMRGYVAFAESSSDCPAYAKP